MKRPLWSWLLLLLWFVIIALMIMRGYFFEQRMLITTGMVSATPGDDFWRMISSLSIMLVLLGGALWCFRIYSVVVGLALFVLGLVVAESVSLFF